MTMTRSKYSYLDLTVLPFLRRKVLSGDATILFSSNFTSVVWANAVGTDLFGGRGIADLLETRLSEGHSLVKQFRNAALQLESNEPIMRGFRITRGFKSELIQCELSKVDLPDGSEAILLVCSSSRRTIRENELAEMAVASLEGFADAAAIVDEYGLVLASSSQFDRMEIDPEQLQELVQIGAGESDRLVKRPMVSSSGAVVAAGLGRIRDVPGRYLVVFAEAGEEESDDSEGPSVSTSIMSASTPAANEALPDLMPDTVSDAASDTTSDEIKDGDSVSDIPPWPLQSGAVPEAEDAYLTRDESDARADDVEHIAKGDDHEETGHKAGPDGTEDDHAQKSSPSLLDRWYFSDSSDKSKDSAEAEPGENPDSVIPSDETGKELAGEPLRFAFTVDRGQVIQSASPELVQCVGEASGNIVGKHWRDIALKRRFDENGAIGNLLEKADTWSGKSVLWPVEGTDMVVPVDLAALPVFDRERKFEGFRGFGIIRVNDMIVDPQATGMSLTGDKDQGEPVQAATSVMGKEPVEDDIALNQNWKSDLAEEDKSEKSEKPGKVQEASNVVNLRRQNERDGADERKKKDSTGDAESDEDIDNTDNGLNPRERQNFKEIQQKLSRTDADQTTEAKAANHEILEALPVPLLIYRSGETLFANTSMLEFSGYKSVEELAGAGGIDALFDDVKQNENSVGTHLLRKDKSQVSVNAKLTSTNWNGAKALCLSLTGISPADSKSALDMIRVSELENILETAADGIVVVTEKGEVESLNSAGEALFGRKHSDVQGKPFVELFATESRPALSNTLSDLIEPGVKSILNQGHEVIGLEAKGGLIPLFVTIGKVGNSNRFCAVLRDITAWKRAEEDLVKAKRTAETASEQKSEFLSRVSHEIREPLNAIIGFSDVMIEERFGPVGSERYVQYLKDINRSGIHVLDIVNDLLDISKIEAGKLELSYEAVDLNQLAGETVALLQPKANDRRIIIRTSLSRAVPKVVADARSIRQIILNLVSNAIKYSERNSQVIVSTTYEENGEVGLRIRDTGEGMTSEQIKNALEPFVQVGEDRMDRTGSSGLGLPLTKALVEANRAYFELESKPGEGTIAHVQFPSQRVLAD